MIAFRHPPWVPTGLTGYQRPDRIRIGFDPDWLRLDLNINREDDPSDVDQITLEATMAQGELPPYGQALARVLAGDPTLSVQGTPP